MSFFLGIPAPPWLCAAVERFQHHYARWARHPQRCEPHITITSPAGLSDDAQPSIETITRDTPPFPITLVGPAVFAPERVLHLHVASPGWQELHRRLVDTLIARSEAEPHPLERSGWIPHLTLFRLHPQTCEQEAVAAARAHLPRTCFTTDRVRLYQQHTDGGRWQPIRDFQLGS